MLKDAKSCGRHHTNLSSTACRTTECGGVLGRATAVLDPYSMREEHRIEPRATPFGVGDAAETGAHLARVGCRAEPQAEGHPCLMTIDSPGMQAVFQDSVGGYEVATGY